MTNNAMNDRSPDRRGFLKTAGLLLGGLALPGVARAETLARVAGVIPAAYKTSRIVIVAFAGGVRSRDTIMTPANVPNLMRIAKTGVVMPKVRSANLGHYGATLSILTGVAQYEGIRETDRGENPTIFEYLRRQAKLGAGDVWLSATGGVQQQNLTHSYHRAYGAAFGANLISSDGIFNAELKGLLDGFGRAPAPTEAEGDALAQLRTVLDQTLINRGVPATELNSPETLRSIEKFLLEELGGATARITGPAAGDCKTMRVAGNLFRAFKPRVLGVVLQQADVAHGSYNAYVDVIRQNDAELGRMWDGIRADKTLRETTSIFILPEFGRNKDLNERNGLDHGDGSADLNQVALIASGPDFKVDKTVTTEVRTIDVCPTMCELLGARPEYAKGKVIRDLFA